MAESTQHSATPVSIWHGLVGQRISFDPQLVLWDTIPLEHCSGEDIVVDVHQVREARQVPAYHFRELRHDVALECDVSIVRNGVQRIDLTFWIAQTQTVHFTRLNC